MIIHPATSLVQDRESLPAENSVLPTLLHRQQAVTSKTLMRVMIIETVSSLVAYIFEPALANFNFLVNAAVHFISTLPLSTHSAVEMLHDSALYKFIIDIVMRINCYLCCVMCLQFGVLYLGSSLANMWLWH